MNEILVSIWCLTYNHELYIRDAIEGFLAQKTSFGYEIIIHDDASTDKTADIAKEHGAIVRYERKQGKGNVMRSMFRDIDAECYILVDGDDTYPAEAAPELVFAVTENGGGFSNRR